MYVLPYAGTAEDDLIVFLPSLISICDGVEWKVTLCSPQCSLIERWKVLVTKIEWVCSVRATFYMYISTKFKDLPMIAIRSCDDAEREVIWHTLQYSPIERWNALATAM